MSPALQTDSLPAGRPRRPTYMYIYVCSAVGLICRLGTCGVRGQLELQPGKPVQYVSRLFLTHTLPWYQLHQTVSAFHSSKHSESLKTQTLIFLSPNGSHDGRSGPELSTCKNNSFLDPGLVLFWKRSVGIHSTFLTIALK